MSEFQTVTDTALPWRFINLVQDLDVSSIIRHVIEERKGSHYTGLEKLKEFNLVLIAHGNAESTNLFATASQSEPLCTREQVADYLLTNEAQAVTIYGCICGGVNFSMVNLDREGNRIAWQGMSFGTVTVHRALDTLRHI
jgi:hypothetical protein